MSTNVTGNSNEESTPVSTSNQDAGRSAVISRHVLRPAIIATSVTYLIMPVIIAGIHISLKQLNTTFWITILIGYAGAIFGWLAGLMASPYDLKEEKRLTRVTAWVSLLTSGYLIGKLEPSISLLFKDGNLITQPLYGVRLLNFLIIFVCTGITVYQYRLYSEGSPAGEAHSDSEHHS